MKITAEACGESKSPENKGKNHGNNAHEIGLRPPQGTGRRGPRAFRPTTDRGVLCAPCSPRRERTCPQGQFVTCFAVACECVGKGNLSRWFTRALIKKNGTQKMPVRISLKLAISASRSEVSGLPWWLSGKESACQRRRHKFDPWSGKIPQAVDQLSLCATTVEPVLYSPGTTTTETLRTGARAPREKPLQWEICGLQLEGRPPLVTTRENPE